MHKPQTKIIQLILPTCLLQAVLDEAYIYGGSDPNSKLPQISFTVLFKKDKRVWKELVLATYVDKDTFTYDYGRLGFEKTKLVDLLFKEHSAYICERLISWLKEENNLS